MLIIRSDGVESTARGIFLEVIMFNVIASTLAAKVGQYVLGSFLMLLAVALIVLVLFQTSKEKGLSGTITGSAETFFGKEKGKDMNKKLSVATTIVGVVFVLAVLVLYILMPDAKFSTIHSNDNWSISPFQSTAVSELQKVEESTDNK